MLIFQAHHYIQPDKVEEYMAATLANARESLKEPGILRFEFFQDQESLSHFSIFEIYKDKAAQEAHRETDHFKTWAEIYYATRERVGKGHLFSEHKP